MNPETPVPQYIPTAADLFGAAPIIEQRCSEKNISFMECKTKCEHPRECLEQAHDVQACVLETYAVTYFIQSSFSVIKERCPNEWSAFSTCLDKYNTRLEDCRRTQKKFMACWNKPEVNA